MGSTTVQLGGQGHHVRGGRAPAAARRAGRDPEVGHVRADLRRAHRVARAASRAASAVRAVPRAARVDDACSSRSTPTVRASSSSTGASVFPRHWVYDQEGKLAAKVGLADFKQWYRKSFGRNTPWGATNSAALVTAVETALERELAGPDHARRRAAEDPQAQARRAAHRAGRARRRGVPRARRRARASRSTATRWPSSARARSSASARCSKAGSARRRCARSRSAGSRSRTATSSTARCSSRSARATGARTSSGPARREAPLLRRARLDVGAGRRVRARRRAHVVCRARARRRTVDARARRGHRHPSHHRSSSTGARSSGRSLLTHLHWDHVQGLPFFAAADRDDAHVRVVMPDQTDADGARTIRPTCSRAR